MNRELVLTVLYDLALTIGSEIDSTRLLDKTLRRLLYHTGFPAGLVIESLPKEEAGRQTSARLIAANGDYLMAEQVGSTLCLPSSLLGGKVELLTQPDLLASLNPHPRYLYCLKLPVDKTLTILLLSPREATNALPITHIFQPILANLAKAVALCRDNESLRKTVEQERDRAQSQRDEALAEMAHERSFLSTLYETLPDMVWLKDPDGVYITCNALFGRFFGHSVSKIIGKTDYDFVSHDLADFFRRNDLAAAAAGKPTANEETLTFPDDGYVGRFHTIKTPMFAADGRFIGVLGVARDINEQHRLLEMLRLRENELENERNLLEQRVAERTNELAHANAHLEQTQFAMGGAGIGVHWVNADTGEILFTNQQAGHMLGYSEEEMLRFKVPEIDPNFPGGDFKQATLSLRKQKVGHFDSVNRHRDGRLIPVTVTLYFVPANSRYPAHFISFIIDITARKETEEALRQAKEVAEEATRAKSIFLANMSHEIRTPMNAIIGLAGLMQRAGVSSQQAEQLSKINRASQHLLEIINNILDLSKIEAGKIQLDREEFTLADLLHSIAAVMGDVAAEKGLSFRVNVAGMPQNYCGDATRLRQALLNFIGNALKFTEEGGISLSGSVLEETSTTYLLRFAITDSGPGLSEEQLSHLFKPFEQADGSITRKYGGTGLGLVISKHLAELMGGAAGVESRLGEGSTFWLTVRLDKGQVQTPALLAAATGISAEAALLAGPAGRRVLLAEDEPINREVALGLLQDVGLLVDIAEDGQEAINKVAEHSYSLILMDMQMPNVDGLGATVAIRQMPHGQHIPIIAMTANAFSEDRQRCMQAGMNDFLTKPVDPDRLFTTLLKWLEPGTAEASTRL